MPGRYVYYEGPYAIDYNGNVTVTQGNGYNDQVYLGDGNSVNNVYISQGDSLTYPGCLPGLGDWVYIESTTVTGDISIVQGDANAVGNYIVSIGDSGAVSAGGYTSIYQYGANNTVTFGGANDPSGIDFQTGYLDVYTGDGGGGFVSAANTDVWYGSGLGNDYVIDGGGDGNTYEDLGNNYGVTVSANYNYV